jgi:hypothetical protein
MKTDDMVGFAFFIGMLVGGAITALALALSDGNGN